MNDPVVFGSTKDCDASIIWLHGLGADGNDFAPLVPELQLPLRYVFPHAPKRPVSINGNMVMRAWYDVCHPDLSQLEDAESIRASAECINHYINAEIASGICSRRIFLAGFSQGGAIALHTGLRAKVPLGGILVLSGYLPLADSIDDEIAAENRETPIMIMHGQHDPVIPIAHAERTRQRLLALHYSVSWQQYPMEHSLYATQVNDIRRWLSLLLSKRSNTHARSDESAK